MKTNNFYVSVSTYDGYLRRNFEYDGLDCYEDDNDKFNYPFTVDIEISNFLYFGTKLTFIVKYKLSDKIERVSRYFLFPTTKLKEILTEVRSKFVANERVYEKYFGPKFKYRGVEFIGEPVEPKIKIEVNGKSTSKSNNK